jgi:flagellar motor switch protein FliN/FliY
MTVQALPFPFAKLETLSAGDVAAAARLRRVGKSYARLEDIAGVLGELLGERVEIRLRSSRPASEPRSAIDSIGVMLSPSDINEVSRRILIEVEGALAAAVVARAIRHRAGPMTDPTRTPKPELAGAIAAVILTALRRTHADAPLGVVAAGLASAIGFDFARGKVDVTTATLSVVLGAETFEARVSVPNDATAAFAVPLSRHDMLAALGAAPLSLPLVVATVLASRSDAAELARGDAFVLPQGTLLVSETGALSGQVALVAPAAEQGLRATLAADGRLVIGGLLESHPWDEVPMPANANSPAIEVLADVPVVVRVELGAVQMSARDWGALAPGDVVTLGRKLGDPALLRIGGVEVARGELVVVDGDYAVRILARTETAQ